MSSNENDAMRRTDVLVEANILIFYTRKSELRMQSYDVMKIAKKLGFREETQPSRLDPDLDLDPVL